MSEANDVNQNDDRPLVPLAGVVYGDIIYWITIVATVVVLIGSVITFTTGHNTVDPGYLLSAIWEGKTVEEVWMGGVGTMPEGHWYLSEITTGNGLTTTGLALGVFGVIPAIFGAAFVLFRERQPLYGGMALVAGFITIAAMFA